MIRSMTAFARVEASGDWGSLSLELRTVNSRFLDIALRLPEELRTLEPTCRERLNARLNRGKLDLSFRYQRPETSDQTLSLNLPLAKRVADISREVDGLLYDPAPVSSLDLMRWPGVMQAAEVDQAPLQESAMKLLEQGLDELIAAREREGDKLKALLQQRCEAIAAIVVQVRKDLPEILQAAREKLQTRLVELKVEVDATRLEQEIAYLAQKNDVDEELDRIDGHLAEIARTLKQKDPVGRRLDFLIQELHREANTLGSKSISMDTTRASVDLKVLIEQMREQVQNIE